jgi:hypothetical protein
LKKLLILFAVFVFIAYNTFSHDLSGIWYHDQQLPENYNELKGVIYSHSDDSPNFIHIVPKVSYTFDFENEIEPFIGRIIAHGTNSYFEVSELITIDENIFIIKFIKYTLRNLSLFNTIKVYDNSVIYEAKITFIDENREIIRIENIEGSNFYITERIYYKIGEIDQPFPFLSEKTVRWNTFLWVSCIPDWSKGIRGTIDMNTKVYIIKIGPIVDYNNIVAPMVLVYIGRYRIIGWMFDGYLY